MKFYNPVIKEVIDKRELCRKFNTSIPSNIEEFNGYYILEDDENNYYSYNEKFEELSDIEIVLENGKYKEKRNILNKNIEDIKHLLNMEVEEKFNEINRNTSLISSLGFEINADETALRNINGLLDVLKDDETREFRLWNNEFKELGKKELNVLKNEIIINGQYLYKQKWDMLSYIEKCNTIQELKDLTIEYTSINFSEIY